MSTILTRKGADYSLNARAFVPPVTIGLIGWWYLGSLGADTPDQALARTTKNLAPGSTYVLSVAGNPTISSGYVTTGPTDYFTSTIPETDDFTVMGLVLPVVASGFLFGYPGPVGGAGHDTGVFSNVSTATTVQSYVSRDTGGGTAAQYNTGTLTLGAGYTTHRIISYKMINSTLVTNLRDLTGGTSNAAAPATPPRLREGRIFRLGGRTTSPGTTRMAFAAVYNRSLSNAEEDSIRTFVAKYRLAKYGDVV